MFKKSKKFYANTKEKSHILNGKGCDGVNEMSILSEEQTPNQDYSTELEFALVSFCVSLFIVFSKLVLVNRGFLQRVYIYGEKAWTTSFGPYKLFSDDKDWLSQMSITSNYVSKDFLEYWNSLLLPLLAGIGMTALTWCMVYIDSCIPGIKPPTPFSPSKDRRLHSPRFHVMYIIAILNGLLLFTLMVLTCY